MDEYGSLEQEISGDRGREEHSNSTGKRLRNRDVIQLKSIHNISD